MAIKSNNAGGENTNRRKTNSKKKKKQQIKIFIFIAEILIILAMLFVVWKVFMATDEAEGPQFTTVEPSDVIINEDVKDNIEATVPDGEEEPKIKGYWNIALFGLDAKDSDHLTSGSRSDSIMVASINKDTGDIKLVSVYRDTYLNIGNDRYTKCNAAYSKGGAAQAISMLNMNLDLNITDFVAVGYVALAECVDALGGVWIDVDSEELKHINNYQISIVNDLAEFTEADYIKVEKSGYQLLNGLQVAGYCRIRATAGSDFARAERQREVIKAMADQAKKANINTLTDIVTKVAKHVYTDIDVKDMIELLKNITDYEIVEEGGFPRSDLWANADMDADGACVVPTDLEKNVVWLHEFLFEEADYKVSSTVSECCQVIKDKTAAHIDKIRE